MRRSKVHWNAGDLRQPILRVGKAKRNSSKIEENSKYFWLIIERTLYKTKQIVDFIIFQLNKVASRNKYRKEVPEALILLIVLLREEKPKLLIEGKKNSRRPRGNPGRCSYTKDSSTFTVPLRNWRSLPELL